jgi:hypothetical protein
VVSSCSQNKSLQNMQLELHHIKYELSKDSWFWATRVTKMMQAESKMFCLTGKTMWSSLPMHPSVNQTHNCSQSWKLQYLMLVCFWIHDLSWEHFWIAHKTKNLSLDMKSSKLFQTYWSTSHLQDSEAIQKRTKIILIHFCSWHIWRKVSNSFPPSSSQPQS